MKQYAQLAVPLLIAAACTSGDQRTPTAPESAPAFARQPAGSIVATDLGTLGGNTSYVIAMNTPSVGNRLLIVGESQDRQGTMRPAYWYVDMASGARLAGAFPIPPGGGQSYALDVNKSEAVVGSTYLLVGGYSMPVRWAPGGWAPSFLNLNGSTYGS